MKIIINNDLRKIILSATKVSDTVSIKTIKNSMTMISANSNSLFLKGVYANKTEVENVEFVLGKKPLELIRMLDLTEEIVISKTDRGIEVKSGDTRASFAEEKEFEGLDLDMNLNEASVFDIDAVKRVIYAASTENIQAALNCIEFSINDNKCSFICSDSLRVARVTEELEPFNAKVSQVKDCEFLIHKNEFSKLASILQGKVAFSYLPSVNKVIFINGPIMIGVKCINEPILPLGKFCDELKKTTNSIFVDRAELIKSIQKTLLIDNKVSIEINNNEVKVSSINKNADLSTTIKVSVDNISVPTTVYLNAKYALDMLNAIDDEEINIYIESPLRPIGCWNEKICNVLLPIDPSSNN